MRWNEERFAKRLRQAREAYRPRGKAWSREKAAVALGFTRNTLDNYERAVTSPTIESVARMADYYGVTIGWLIGISDEGGPQTPDMQGAGQSSQIRYSAVTRPLSGSMK